MDGRAGPRRGRSAVGLHGRAWDASHVDMGLGTFRFLFFPRSFIDGTCHDGNDVHHVDVAMLGITRSASRAVRNGVRCWPLAVGALGGWNWKASFKQRRGFTVLHEDEHLLVIDKPRSMPVHGGSKVDARDTVIGRLNDGRSDGRPPLFLVHRLDAATTGALVLAKSRDVARLMERAFARNRVDKTYVAAVVPEEKEKEKEKGRMSWRSAGVIERDVGGKPARTLYSTVRTLSLSSSSPCSIPPCHVLELKPETGRTHQLRIHTAMALNAPILGDVRYGRTRDAAQRAWLEVLEGAWQEWEREQTPSSPPSSSPSLQPPLFLHCKTLKIPFIRETVDALSLDPTLFTRVDAPLPLHFVLLGKTL